MDGKQWKIDKRRMTNKNSCDKQNRQNEINGLKLSICVQTVNKQSRTFCKRHLRNKAYDFQPI